MKYDDDRFGVIERKWFGLTKKCGGETAAGFTFGTTDATKNVHVTRWYPKGPIRLQKFGYLVLATTSGGATVCDYVPARVQVDGSNETSSDLQVRNAATQYVINSVTGFTNRVVDAGSYITIKSATAVSDDGTDAKSATFSGTVAFFIDYARQPHNKWMRDTEK
jgi:hypothetical protein